MKYKFCRPNIAQNTITANLSASWKGYTVNPCWIIKTGRSDATGSLADWNSLDVNISKTISLKKSLSLDLNISAKNLLDCRYELVSGISDAGKKYYRRNRIQILNNPVMPTRSPINGDLIAQVNIISIV